MIDDSIKEKLEELPQATSGYVSQTIWHRIQCPTVDYHALDTDATYSIPCAYPTLTTTATIATMTHHHNNQLINYSSVSYASTHGRSPLRN